MYRRGVLNATLAHFLAYNQTMIIEQKIMRFVFISLFSMIALVCEARMYQWVEPGVETTQLSGKPPAWYRSAAGGPRIFVFENGRLIDDTQIEVTDEVRQRLREDAFLRAEEDRQKAKEKIAKAKEKEERLEKKASETEEVSDEIVEKQDPIELITDTLFPKEEKKEESENIQDIDELKKIIADWEASQSENARKALE